MTKSHGTKFNKNNFSMFGAYYSFSWVLGLLMRDFKQKFYQDGNLHYPAVHEKTKKWGSERNEQQILTRFGST